MIQQLPDLLLGKQQPVPAGPGGVDLTAMAASGGTAPPEAAAAMPTQQSYAQMLGMTQQGESPVGPGMAALTDPSAAMAVSQITRPAQSPAELEARKTGWQQVAEKLSDPNLLRALGFAGAAMAQPGGTIGGGIASGLTAFQAGEYAQRQQGIEDRAVTMKERETEADIAFKGATTDLRRAQLPGVEAESQVATETAGTKVQAAKTELENLKFKLEKAQSEEEIDKLQREYDKRKWQLIKGIPDAKLRGSLIADMDKTSVEIESKRAAARENRAQAERYELERRAIKNLPDEKLRQYFTKTGEFASATGGAGSARLAQNEKVWRTLYQGLKKDGDPQVKEVSEDQFVRDRLVKDEDRDTMVALTRALQYVDPGSPEEENIKRQLGSLLESRDRTAGTKQAPAAGGGQVWVRDPKTGKVVPQK